MDALGLENILKTNRDWKEEDINIYQNKFVSRLTNKSIKFQVDALFRNFKKTSHCGWNIKVNNKHVVEDWPKAEEWRKKWRKKVWNILNLEPLDFLWHIFKIERNFEKWAKTINETIEELSVRYFQAEYKF